MRRGISMILELDSTFKNVTKSKIELQFWPISFSVILKIHLLSVLRNKCWTGEIGFECVPEWKEFYGLAEG